MVQRRQVIEEASVRDAVRVALSLFPRECPVVVPLARGRQLGAHEEQLLARLPDLVGEQRA